MTLSPEAQELQTTLRRFVAERMPRENAAEWDRKGHYPREVAAELASLGVFGLTIPEEYGGVGRDIAATMMVIEELSARSLAVAIPYIMGACYAGMTVVDCGDDRQKKELLPKIAVGELLFAYGWTEPDVGSDLASVRTTITREGDEIVVNGAKRFCTGAGIADYIYTLGCSDPDGDRYRNLSMVLVPPNAPGVTIEYVDGMGAKGATTTDVTLEDVRVPVENLMGGRDGWNQGWKQLAGVGLDIEKLEVAAMALGLARAAYEDAWDYSRQRRQFGQPIAGFQDVRHRLASMKTDLYASRLVLEDAVALADAHEPCGVETSMAKLFVTERAKHIVLEAQTIFGAYGYVKGFDCERYVRDVLLMPIIGGSSAIQRNNIAKWSGIDR